MTQAAYETVKMARDSERPTGLDYIKNIFRNFIEFHGDRRFGDDHAIIGGIGRLNGMPVTVIAIEKGQSAKLCPLIFRLSVWSKVFLPDTRSRGVHPT